MLSMTCAAKNAVLVLHEIYGINRHIREVCGRYHSLGYDIHCPNLLERKHPFPYSRQDDAYAYFMGRVGFDASAKVDRLLDELSSRYARIFLVGYSVGATIAWLASQNGNCAGAVCHYGTRIRDYPAITPRCPVLLIAGEHDEAFPCRDIGSKGNYPHPAGKTWFL